MSQTRDRLLVELTKRLTDEGKLIEAGWIGLMRAAIPPDAPPVQIREMRLAFMAGAQHLWGSIISMLDDDEEATPEEERRMGLIAKELDAFAEEVRADARFKEAEG